MIDREAFKAGWYGILLRFGVEFHKDQAAAYYEYLSPQMETGDFLQAAQAIWATAKWFPRPVDFVLIGTAGEWSDVLKVAELYRPPDAGWVVYWGSLSKRSQDACRNLGGLTVVRRLYERDPIKLKQEWEKAFEQVVTREALALPTPRSQLAALS